MAKAETVLNNWLPLPIQITRINISKQNGSLNTKQLLPGGPEQYTLVEMDYHGALTGNCYVLLQIQNARELVEFLTKRDYTGKQFDDVYTATIMETGIIMARGIIGSISNLMKQNIKLTSPKFIQGDWNDFLLQKVHTKNKTSLIIQWFYTISEKEIGGKIILPLDNQTTETIINTIKSVS